MACGSCGQRYTGKNTYAVVGHTKGSTVGVIKKAQLEAQRNAAKQGEAKASPPSIPVDGTPGPSKKTE